MNHDPPLDGVMYNDMTISKTRDVLPTGSTTFPWLQQCVGHQSQDEIENQLESMILL